MFSLIFLPFILGFKLSLTKKRKRIVKKTNQPTNNYFRKCNKPKLVPEISVSFKCSQNKPKNCSNILSSILIQTYLNRISVLLFLMPCKCRCVGELFFTLVTFPFLVFLTMVCSLMSHKITFMDIKY